MTNAQDKNGGKTPVNESRRTLTKAGLAIPAVLGTLASRPVLAAVPWKCTISGQVSGNVSGHENEICTSVGTSHATFRDVTYPVDSTAKLSDAALFPGLQLFFFWNGTGLSSSNANPEATIHQILANSAPSGLDYAQKAVVLLLNAKSIGDTSIYPLTELQAKKLYVAAGTPGGTYSDTNPTVNWSNAQVKYYIDLLYH